MLKNSTSGLRQTELPSQFCAVPAESRAVVSANRRLHAALRVRSGPRVRAFAPVLFIEAVWAETGEKIASSHQSLTFAEGF